MTSVKYIGLDVHKESISICVRNSVLFRTTPATIYTIARTGAMLLIGQERSSEKVALAAEPRRASDFSWATP